MNCGTIKYNAKSGKYVIRGLQAEEVLLFEDQLIAWFTDFNNRNRESGGRFGDVQEFILKTVWRKIRNQIERENPVIRLEPAQVKVIVMSFGPSSHLIQLCDKAQHTTDPLPLEQYIQMTQNG